ncbi:hypothetical protein WP9W18E04_15990 [Aeromonas veronii]|nr:hypothetical protein WP9W18E04_15990 [Aeromonas veronii]
MSQSVSNRVIRNMLGACQQQGGDPEAIMRAGGLTSFDIAREQGRIPAHSHYRMLQLMQPYLAGFHETILSYDIGQLYQHYPPLISLCLNQPSPRAALEVLLAYRPIIGSCDELRVQQGAQVSQYQYVNQGPAGLGASQAIPNFIIIYRILRVYLADVRVSVGFTGQPPQRHQLLDQFFGTRCRWDQGENTLTIDNAQLDRPSHCYNEPLGRLQLAQLAQICADIAERTPFAYLVGERIRHKIRKGALESDESLLKEVCAAMNVSRWTLNRKLQGEGSCFSTILREVRVSEACRLLEEGAQPLQDISDRVGFSSQSAFNRFFKANIRMTPLAYRNARQ